MSAALLAWLRGDRCALRLAEARAYGRKHPECVEPKALRDVARVTR